jgi:ligand-binding sensor domain-containing protein
VKLRLFIVLSTVWFGVDSIAQSDSPGLDFTCSKLDDQGILWLGSETDGLWRIQRNSIEPYIVEQLPNPVQCYAMTLDPQGHLWLASRNELIEYDYQHWREIPITDAGTADIGNVAAVAEKNRVIRSITVNHLDHVLMGCEDAITGQQILMRYNGHTYVDLIKPFKVSTVFEDLDALIWMAGGAYRMEEGKLVLKVSLPHGLINAALQDSRGDIWLAIDKGGMYRYDGQNFRYYGDDYGFSDLRISCLHEDERGRIWMGTEKMDDSQTQGLSYFEAGAFHHLQDSPECPVKSVNTIASDKKGVVWFAGDNGALYHYSGRKFHTVETTVLLQKR